jgi:hypothetical protein
MEGITRANWSPRDMQNKRGGSAASATGKLRSSGPECSSALCSVLGTVDAAGLRYQENFE